MEDRAPYGETPRTDEAETYFEGGGWGVPIDFARTLERALAAANARADALQAERDAAFAMSRCECASEEACANLAKLHERADAAERDAKRYRWLRTDTYGDVYNGYSIPEELDAAIDTAII